MNEKIACESVEPLLTAYLLGELPDDKSAFVRKHLESCSTCRASAQDLASTLDLLRGALAVGPETAAHLTPERRARVRAARPTATRLWFGRTMPLLARVALWLILPAVLIGLMLPAGSGAKRRAMQVQLAMDRSESASAPAPDMAGAVAESDFDSRADRESTRYGWSDDSYSANGTLGLDLKKDKHRMTADEKVGGKPVGGKSLDQGRGEAFATESREEEMVPLKLELPNARFMGTPVPGPTVMPPKPSPPPPAVVPEETVKETATYFRENKPAASQTGMAAKAPAAPMIGDVPVTGRLFGKGSESASGGNGSGSALDAAVVAQTPEPARPATLGRAGSSVQTAVYAVYDDRAKDSLTLEGERDARGVTSAAAALPSEQPTDGLDVEDASRRHARARASKPADAQEVNGALRSAEAPAPGQVEGVATAAGTILPLVTNEPAAPATPPALQDIPVITAQAVAPRLEKELEEKDDPTPPAEPTEPAVFHAYEETAQNAFSTFGIDVDTASYTRARRSILQGRRPEPESVRTEEFVNAFDYAYSPPASGTFAIYAEAAPSPFRRSMDTLKIGIRGKVLGRDRQRASVLTLVVDTSGSMETPERIGLIRKTLRLLVERLGPEDSVALVQFSNRAHLLFDHARPFDKAAALAAIDRMQVAGSTQLAEGIKLGYEVAARAFRPAASNRVFLLSDGVANLGENRAEPILQAVEGYRRQGLYLSVFGFGTGAYNDRLLETLADKGDGAYAFIDSTEEAKRLLADQLDATLHVIAADVKIQVEFNPKRVKQWRQLGYENRKLTQEQFRDDTVDAGEVGSGQSVTALYDIELHGSPTEPIGTVRLRYRDPETGRVEEVARRLGDADRGRDFAAMPASFQLAACVAEYAELLRLSPYTFSGGKDFREVEKALAPVATRLPLDPRVQELQRLAQATQGLPW